MRPQIKKFKDGDRVRIKETGFIGNIVKIYFDQEYNSELYVICKVKLDASGFSNIKDVKDITRYLEELPKKIKTTLECKTVKLNSEDDLAKLS
jgi:hypothetical protein